MVKIVLYTLVSLSIMLIATAIIVLSQKVRDLRGKWLAQDLEGRLQTALYEVLEGSRKWRGRHGQGRKVLKNLMIRLAVSVKGETYNALQSDYVRLGFLAEDMQSLGSRWTGQRLNTLDRLEVMADTSAIDPLTIALRDRIPIIRIRAARLLYKLGYRDMNEIARVLDPSQLSLTRYFAQVLVDIGAPLTPTLVRYVDEHPTASNAGLIVRIIGETKRRALVDHLLRWLQSPGPEVRINALRVLATLAIPEVVPSMVQCLTDPHPVVRMMAIRGLGDLSAKDLSQHLSSALRDEDPRVAREAALALQKMGLGAQIPVAGLSASLMTRG